MRGFSESEIATLRTDLREWYEQYRRLLPWRGDNLGGIMPPPVSAYGIMVSEIMLQQTQVDTVIPYWRRWMEKFPDIVSLAHATLEEVNSVWAGLGYYRRAKALSDCAKVLVEKYEGEMPREYNILLSLPGIGPYTAGAISSIAFNSPHAAVDGNVVRVLSRLRAIDQEGTQLEKTCRTLGVEIVDPDSPSTFNQALMELGALICKPKNPSCGTCPVRRLCRANQLLTTWTTSGDIEETVPKAVTDYPKKIPKKPPVDLGFIIIAIRHQARPGKFLFSRRPPKGLLANQWELPSVPVAFDQDPSAENWAQALAATSLLLGLEGIDTPEIVILHKHNTPLVHIFSHQRHHMFLLELMISDSVTLRDEKEGSIEWMNPEELSQRGITTGVKKILNLVRGSCEEDVTKASRVEEVSKVTSVKAKKRDCLGGRVSQSGEISKKTKIMR
jgi:A/G-specific adenine glycosylase